VEEMNELIEATRENIVEAEKQLKMFKGFADEVLARLWEGLGVEGDEIQEIGLKHGLIEEYTATEPCCDNCVCAEIMGDDEFPVKCYRKTY
jgi:hypothetical protein